MLAWLRSFSKTAGRRVPPPVLPYALSLAALAALIGMAQVSYLVFGPHLPALLGGLLVILLLLLILGAAWLGYGPGILVAALATLAIPRLRSTNRTLTAELFRFALTLIVSLLVSSLSRIRSRREAVLRRTAAELEVRVRERSEEALTSALAYRDAEDRLRFVLDSADIGYMDYDLARRSSARSLKHDQIFGYPEGIADWDYRKLLGCVHREDRRLVKNQLRALFSTDRAEAEFRVFWPDGSLRWIWAQARAHRTAGGARPYQRRSHRYHPPQTRRGEPARAGPTARHGARRHLHRR